jgi:diaminohydroxyphosphoribosylaminopyrimidine deaminase/5-amino-6-(5-phosphoribosylamino)uracil reductase
MGTEFTERDRAHMQRALALARRGQGRVEPNPMVGCVLTRAGRVLGEGYHQFFGGPHAEVNALRRASGSARGATVYVTLEPCCHFGKTPPCTDALIRAGVSRVVAAMVDPSEPVCGRGIRRLRAAGIRVDVGLLEPEARALNHPFVKLTLQGRPHVILKWAQSLDGRIATRTGHSRWISGEVSREQVHRLRARVDAILVGVGTVIADDPRLDARRVPVKRIATRVVLDTQLRIPERCHLVDTAKRIPTLILTSPQSLRGRSAKVRRLTRRGVVVEACRTRRGKIDLSSALMRLGDVQFSNVLVEGGSRVLTSFLDAGLADEAYVFVAPRLIGGASAPSPWGGIGVSDIRESLDILPKAVCRVGRDLLYHFNLCR